ncbi:MAG: tetraacyldisaccharide 4'-kinase [Acidobacteria bacterium]|nr:MAG: tetraacyldisaccharide 4'-kinase [Acidobacteriota bacterium]
MKGARPGALRPPPPPRSPWQLLYGAAHRWRRRYWARRAGRLPRPVISVGNLCFGGGGKTPLVAAVAAHLRDRGRRVAVLSRGYPSRGRGVRVVSVGEAPLLGPQRVGDEPVLLAGMLPGVAVVVAADRRRAGAHALLRLEPPPDVFLLDDGFAHLRLHRDLDLLAFPAADPFAGGRLPPGGRLREPLAAAAHADAVILTGAREDDRGEELAAALRPYGFNGPGFASRTVCGAARLTSGEPLAAGARVLAVAAIARPEAFFADVRRAGFEIAAELALRDHHPYPPATRKRIAELFAASGADAVLTTGKDRVKLQGNLDLPLAELPIHARPEARFFAWLDRRLAEIDKPGDGG